MTEPTSILDDEEFFFFIFRYLNRKLYFWCATKLHDIVRDYKDF